MNTKRYFNTLLIFALGLVLAALLLGGCSLPGAEGQPLSPEALYTAAAQTVVAQMTQVAQGTPVSQLTPGSTAPTVTPPAGFPSPTQPAPAGNTAVPTNTPTTVPPTATTVPPTATSVPPTPLPPTATPLPCDWAEFVKDVSAPDGTEYAPGAEFTKIWRIRNRGACTWNSSYELVFVKGSALTSQTTKRLPGNVRPGETVDLSIDLTAPGQEGRYRGYWMLRNANGQVFGIGPQADMAFWVLIEVTIQPNSSYAYDFAANFCNADWSSGQGAINCTNDTHDPEGSVALLQDPDIEGRHENEPTLWVRPNQSADGWITGKYPAYKVKNGDHFLAEIGCLDASDGCDVTFKLDYQTSGGTVRNLGAWREVYDGKTAVVDVDLSGLAGNAVQFMLTVNNNGKVKAANAFWLVPHIQSNPKADNSNLALVWQQNGGVQNVCHELRIYLTGTQAGEAHAYSCQNAPSQELGARQLSANQLNQFLAWYNNLRAFNSEQNGVDPSGTLNIKMSFNGNGAVSVTTGDINSISSFAENLWNQVMNP